MRIGVNTLFLVPGDVGGTEIFLRRLVVALAGEYPENTLVLFTTLDNDQSLRQELQSFTNIEYVCLPFVARIRPLRILCEQLLLPWAAMLRQLDVMWSPGYTAPFWVPCPQVVTIHDLQYKHFPEDMSRLECLTLDILVRMACRRCRQVVTISEFSRQEVIRFGFAPPEKVRAVLLGVDPAFAEPAPAEEIRAAVERYLPPGTPYILCVAHTYPHKKVDLLIRAFGRIMAQIPHSLLVIGRARRGEPLVQEAVASLADPRRYIRLDQGVDYRSLQLLYQGAELFVLPSAYEGFGLPIIEAMMSSTPVLTTTEGSLPEVGGEAVDYMTSFADEALAAQLLWLVHEPRETKSKQSIAAKNRAASFAWRNTAQGMMAVFSSIVCGQDSAGQQ